jgi:hypothetical protein
MENIKSLMTELELSTYEKLEAASEALRHICNYEKRTLGYAASELLNVIIQEMSSIREDVAGKHIVRNIKNDLYYVDNSFSVLFTGWAYWEDSYFRPDNGTYDYIYYFKNGRMMTSNVSRNVKEYVTDDNWYILPDKTMSEKSGVMFNLGGNIPLAFMTGVDFPYELKNDVAEEISRRLESAAKKGITAYKMK